MGGGKALFQLGCPKHQTVVPAGESIRCPFCKIEELTAQLEVVEGERNGLALERDLARTELIASQEEVGRLRELESRAWYVYKDGIDEAAYLDEWPDSIVGYVHSQLIFILACDPDAEPPAGVVTLTTERDALKTAVVDLLVWIDHPALARVCGAATLRGLGLTEDDCRDGHAAVAVARALGEKGE